MVQGGILLVILGVGSFILQIAGLLSGIGFISQSQPLVGSLMIVTGIGMLWYNFLNNQKTKGISSPKVTTKAVEEYSIKPEINQSQVSIPIGAEQPRYKPQPLNPPTTPARPITPLNAAQEQEYINRLAYGIQLAQNGSKEEANQLLNQLFLMRPTDTTLLMWLAFTSADLTTSRNFINRIAQLEPDNPTLPNAQHWLATQENQAK